MFNPFTFNVKDCIADKYENDLYLIEKEYNEHKHKMNEDEHRQALKIISDLKIEITEWRDESLSDSMKKYNKLD